MVSPIFLDCAPYRSMPKTFEQPTSYNNWMFTDVTVKTGQAVFKDVGRLFIHSYFHSAAE